MRINGDVDANVQIVYMYIR